MQCAYSYGSDVHRQAGEAVSASPSGLKATDLAVDPRTDVDAGRWLRPAGGVSQVAALEVWDDESWHALCVRRAQLARDSGALVHLQFALNLLAWPYLFAGELATAAQLIEEDHLIAEATGNPPVGYSAIMLAAWRGREPAASELIEGTVREATGRGLGSVLHDSPGTSLTAFVAYASSVLCNSLGRYDAARDAAWHAFEHYRRGYTASGVFVVPELAEAASRTGDLALARAALEWISERTQVTPTDWALGIEALIRAFLSEGAAAESLYREAVDRLALTRVRAQLARAHLLFGEWLRRERRRAEAREQLRTAHGMLNAMGIEALRSGPAASCWPPARPPAGAPSRPAIS